MNSQLKESAAFLRSKTTVIPQIGIVLGSGLGDFGKQLHNPDSVPTSTIPHFPVSTVHGHAGKILFGTIKGGQRTSEQLMVFQGRVHLYESDDIQKVVFPIRLAAEMGVTHLILTNAAGGINRRFESGTLMFISDYINLTGEKVLHHSPGGRNDAINSHYLDTELLSQAKTIAVQQGIATEEGVYCWTKGPSYESAAEIRMMEKIGADAVGMSTVPEIITARHYGMKVLGISCITNMATGISPTKLSHDEVTETANNVKADFTKLVSEIILQMFKQV